jgi:hypothetical protein
MPCTFRLHIGATECFNSWAKNYLITADILDRTKGLGAIGDLEANALQMEFNEDTGDELI